jgi:arsenate reductase (glutaredoxin)
MKDLPITVYHNPNCGTSRTTLSIIREAGYEPTVVEYLKQGWTRPMLEGLLAAMDVGPREILRTKEALATELGLLAADVDAERILDAMVRHPILVNRPIVVTPNGVLLARPAERVREVLSRTS